MKKQFVTLGVTLLFAVGSSTFIGCGNEESNESENHEHMEEDGHNHEHAEEHNHGNHKHEQAEERDLSVNTGELKGDMTKIMESYYQLSNSLVEDDSEGAAEAGNKLKESLENFKASELSEGDTDEINEILESAIENSEHIAKSEIDHQREHLVVLSVDIKDMISIVGTSSKIYEDFCPMANDGDGAIWLSNKEEISNPYMGSKMPKCGKVNSIIE